jgi:hypothetical protein
MSKPFAVELEEHKRVLDIRRRRRIAEAHAVASKWMPDHVELATMSLLLLREEHGAGKVTKQMVRKRCERSYPDSFNGTEATHEHTG